MELNILESSNINSTSPTEWETKFSKDYCINDGDMIGLKNAFININENSNTNIEIEEDTIVHLEFAYYIINGIQNVYKSYDGNNQNPWKYLFTPTYLNSNGDVISSPFTPPSNYNVTANEFYYEQTDFKLYVYHRLSEVTNRLELFVNKKEFTILKGSYSPTEIANIITQHMNGINNQNLQNAFETQNMGLNTGTKLLVNIATDSQSYINDAFVGTSYTKEENVNYLNHFSLLINLDEASIPDNILNESSQYYIGTNQFALDFNEDSQKFQFSFMHSPLYDTSGNVSTWYGQTYWDGIDFVGGDKKTAFGPLSQQSKFSGIFFTNLEPKSFWTDKLGFNYREIVVDVSNGLNLDEVKTKTTDNLSPINALQMVLSPYKGYPYLQDTFAANGYTAVSTYLSSSDILPLTSRYQYQSSNSGYYYIFADLFFNNSLDTGEQYHECCALASKFFLNSDYVHVFEDASINYVHYGQPLLLSSVKIKILDSQKKIPKNLKKNSTIFFQIIKSQQQTNSIVKSHSNPIVK